MECSGVYHVPQEAPGQQPCTHSWLSPRAALQELGTVVFQPTVCVFCQSKCLRHPAALLWVHWCKCTHRTSGNAFFCYFTQDQLDAPAVWAQVYLLAQCAVVCCTAGKKVGAIPEWAACAVWLPKMLCSAFGSNLHLTWSELNSQPQFHLIQINVFSSLVSLVAGYKIICLTSSLLSHVTHSSSWKVNMFSVINSKD